MASPLPAVLRTRAGGAPLRPARPTDAGATAARTVGAGFVRLLRGRADDPRWARPALALLLVATAALYLVALGASGWANAFYSAAAQAGSQSWKAWFFGASDAPGMIMVDKPPAALWVMGLSARLFGVNAWTILVPQALMGVAAVATLHAAVRRWAGPVAGLLGGGVLALTPVATLMFRFNNPDALLVLLLVVASWAVVRAVDAPTSRRATGWLVLAAVAVGTGFLTKSLQAFLVLPALTLVWLLAGPGRLRGRLVALVPTATALVAASGWWIAVVELWPAADRPYVGGSQTNSALELVLGYNGLGRLTGDEVGSVGGGGGVGGPGAAVGGVLVGGGRSSGSLLQLVTGEMATQVSWLLPASLLVGVAALVLTGRAPRTDRTRAALLLWGVSLAVNAAVLTLSRGIIHPYYSVALAPGIAGLLAVGATAVVRRGGRAGLATVAAAGAMTSVWAWWLLRTTPTFLPWLRAVVLVAGLAVAAVLTVAALLPRHGSVARLVTGLVVATVALGIAAPAAYSLQTVATAHTGALPTAGPGEGRGGPGGPGGPDSRGGPGGPGGPGGLAGPGGAGAPGAARTATPPAGGPGGTPPGAAGSAAPTTGGGNVMTLLRASTPGPALTALLVAGAPGHTWVAATVGSNAAAGYQLASGAPVMALGGFNGTDPAPTLEQFQADVAWGAVHYFVGDVDSTSTGSATTGGSDAAARIAAWVAAHYTARSVDGTTVYDLTAPAG